MRTPSKDQYICYLISTSFFCLGMLGLTIYHSSPRCTLLKASDTYPDDNCEAFCPINATTFKTSFWYGTVRSTCPWNSLALIIGLIGLSIAQISLVFRLIAIKKSKLQIPAFAFSGLTMIVLIISVGFMFKDWITGGKYQKENFSDSYNLSITHAVNVCLLMVFLLIFAWVNCQSTYFIQPPAPKAAPKTPRKSVEAPQGATDQVLPVDLESVIIPSSVVLDKSIVTIFND